MIPPCTNFQTRITTRMDKKIENYVQQARERVSSVDYTTISQDFWNRPEIVDYYSKLPSDEYNERLAESVASDLTNSKILIVGGAAGRLGREIARSYNTVQAIELDSSKKMAGRAKSLAEEQSLDQRFHSIQGTGEMVPLSTNSTDRVVAGGFMRYFEVEKRVRLSMEMRRVSSGQVILAEGRVKNVLEEIAFALDHEHELLSESVEAINMTLYFELLETFKKEAKFRKLVEERADDRNKKYWEVLQELAGYSVKELHQLKIKS